MGWSTIELLIIGASIHAANFEAIYEGKVTLQRAVILSIIGGFTVLFFASQYLSFIAAMNKRKAPRH